MTEPNSVCKVCQELILETGNYSIKIIPGKSVPKKASKVHLDLDTSASLWGLTKFQKYLVKHSTPKNYVEITCGTCKSAITYPMIKKNLYRQRLRKNRKDSSTIESLSQSRKKRKKKSKDLNAGLTLPESFRPSASPSFTSTPSKSPAVGSTPMRTSLQQQPGSGSGSSQNKSSSNVQQNQVKFQAQSAKNLLQKALFKSSQSDSNNSSLHKFLS